MAWRKGSESKNLVGSRVRQARQEHQPPLDQADLAAKLSDALEKPFDRTTVVRIEAGVRAVSDIELVALAKVMGIEVTWLLFGDA